MARFGRSFPITWHFRPAKGLGVGVSSERASEISGIATVTSERNSEITGRATPSERNSEIHGTAHVTSERASEILGIILLPVKLSYRIIVRDENGEPIGEFEAFRNLNFGKRLNNYGTASFEVRVNDPKISELIALRQYSVWIYRKEGISTHLVWSGEQANRSAKLVPSKDNWATIYCFDWLEQLAHRRTAALVTYTSEDAGAIAWDLIDTTNGDDDTGITQGSIAITVDRDRQYHNDNIMNMIINLSNVLSGFDFEVDNNKVFNVASVMGTDKTADIVLEYGKNITDVTLEEDFSHPITRAIVLGEAVGETTLQRVDRNDAGLQTLYGLREDTLQQMDVSELTTLEDQGDAAIRKYGQPLFKITFALVGNSSPSIVDFGLGDGVTLRIVSGMYDIDEQYRIFEWSINMNEKNVETLTLTLGKFTI